MWTSWNIGSPTISWCSLDANTNGLPLQWLTAMKNLPSNIPWILENKALDGHSWCDGRANLLVRVAGWLVHLCATALRWMIGYVQVVMVHLSWCLSKQFVLLYLLSATLHAKLLLPYILFQNGGGCKHPLTTFPHTSASSTIYRLLTYYFCYSTSYSQNIVR